MSCGLTLAGLGDSAGAEAAWRRAIELVRGSRLGALVASLPLPHLCVQLLLDAKRDAAALLDEAPTPVSGEPFAHLARRARARRERRSRRRDAAVRRGWPAIDADALGPGPLAYDASIFGAAGARGTRPVRVSARPLRRERLNTTRAPKRSRPTTLRSASKTRSPASGRGRNSPRDGSMLRTAGMSRRPPLLFVAPIPPAQVGNGLAMRAQRVSRRARAGLRGEPARCSRRRGFDDCRTSSFQSRRATRPRRAIVLPPDGKARPAPWEQRSRAQGRQARRVRAAAFSRVIIRGPALCRWPATTPPSQRSARAAF